MIPQKYLDIFTKPSYIIIISLHIMVPGMFNFSSISNPAIQQSRYGKVYSHNLSWSCTTTVINFANLSRDRVTHECWDDSLQQKIVEYKVKSPFTVSIYGESRFQNFISGFSGYHQNVEKNIEFIQVQFNTVEAPRPCMQKKSSKNYPPQFYNARSFVKSPKG